MQLYQANFLKNETVTELIYISFKVAVFFKVTKFLLSLHLILKKY